MSFVQVSERRETGGWSQDRSATMPAMTDAEMCVGECCNDAAAVSLALGTRSFEL